MRDRLLDELRARVRRLGLALGNLRVRFIFSEYSCRRRLRAPVCSGPQGKGGAGIICLNPPRPASQIVQSSTCNPAILPKARSIVTSPVLSVGGMTDIAQTSSDRATRDTQITPRRTRMRDRDAV